MHLTKDKKISLISHAIVLCIAAALLIVASFYDLAINHALSNSESVYGLLFVSLGEFPAYIILPMCGVIWFYADLGIKDRRLLIVARLASAILVWLGFFIWGAMGSRITETPKVIELSALYSILFAFFTMLLGKYLKINFTKYVRFAVFALFVMLVSLVVIRLIKIGWGRMRYRDMLKVGNFSGFTPWYIPNGYNGNTSFPSGHTASACNIFIFVILFKGKRRYIANAIALLFVVLTMFSRIVVNAHFLSDVLIGGLVSYLCYFVIRLLFERKKSIIPAVEESASYKENLC